MEVVFHADDVVLAGVLAHLDFHDHEREAAFVLEAVHLAHRDVGRLVRADQEHLVADSHGGGTAHHDPVLGTVQVLLQAEALARLHHDALHLVALGGFEHGVSTPRAAHRLRHVHEVGAALLELFHNLLHLLAAAERGDQECVRSVDDEHLVEVNRRDGALASHHEGVLRAHRDVARVHVVAVLVVRVFSVQTIKASEVAPADVAQHDLHLLGLLHHGVVDGVRRDSEHVVAVNADGFAVLDGRVGERLLCGGEHLRGVLAKFREEGLRLEAEDAAVPVEVACEQVLLGGRQVGLFHEALHVLAVGLDVAVARLGARGRDAERHEVTRLGEFLRTEEHLLVLFLLTNHVVRRGDEHDGLRVHGKACDRDRGRGVAAHGFQQELAAVHAFHLELVLREEELVGVRDDKLRLADGGVRDDRLAEQGLPVKERGELLGHQGTAHGPKARARTTTEDQVNHRLISGYYEVNVKKTGAFI